MIAAGQLTYHSGHAEHPVEKEDAMRMLDTECLSFDKIEFKSTLTESPTFKSIILPDLDTLEDTPPREPNPEVFQNIFQFLHTFTQKGEVIGQHDILTALPQDAEHLDVILAICKDFEQQFGSSVTFELRLDKSDLEDSAWVLAVCLVEFSMDLLDAIDTACLKFDQELNKLSRPFFLVPNFGASETRAV